MSAIVCAVSEIRVHPDADKLEVITLAWPARNGQYNPNHYIDVVAGPHYRAGQRGVYVAPGNKIPGYLAEDAWLVGRGKASQWYAVESKIMRGIASPGLFFGQFYEKDTRKQHTAIDLRAEQRAGLQKALGKNYADDMKLATPVYEWRYWRSHWQLGEDVSAYLGIT